MPPLKVRESLQELILTEIVGMPVLGVGERGKMSTDTLAVKETVVDQIQA